MRDPATKEEFLLSLRANQRPLMFPLVCWLGVIACVIWIVAGLSGCATPQRDAEVCYVQLMGHTQEGMTVVLQQCITPEAFQESQK